MAARYHSINLRYLMACNNTDFFWRATVVSHSRSHLTPVTDAALYCVTGDTILHPPTNNETYSQMFYPIHKYSNVCK